MVPPGSRFTPRRLAAVALLFVALVLAIVGMFTSWWTWNTEVSGSFGGSGDATARPFSDGDFDDAGVSELGTPALVTGLLFLFGLLALAGALVVKLLPGLGISVPRALTVLLPLATVALGLAAVLYTTFGWPSAIENGPNFWDKERSSSSGGGFTFDSTTTTAAGAGWYMGIVAVILVPSVTLFLGLGESSPVEPSFPRNPPSGPPPRPMPPPAPTQLRVTRPPTRP